MLALRLFSGRCHARAFRLVQPLQFHTSDQHLAGHSKWANIKHIKAEKDGQRAVLFSRIVRQIRLAIQEGGSPNPQLNSLLQNAVDDAVRRNMPMSTIQNTIKRFEQTKTNLEKHILEIKLINGPIYMVCVMYTDNFAALRMTMAPVVKKAGATFVEARHLFDDCGLIETVKPNATEEACTTDAIECGAEEIDVIDTTLGTVHFFCNPVELDRVSRDLITRGYKVDSAEHVFTPKVLLKVDDDTMKGCEQLANKLKGLDGISEIYCNCASS